MKLFALCALLFFSQGFFAHADDWSKYTNIPASQALQQLSPAPQGTLSNHFRLMTWNVEKGEHKDAWAVDFRHFADSQDLVLLQEGMQDDFMPDVLKSVSHLGWWMSRSFFLNVDHDATGVITGAPLEPLTSIALHTSDTEPVTNTPKAILISEYALTDGSRLLVVNVHGINFTSPFPFYREIDDVIAVIKHWNGKVVMAGDFNTWAPARTDYLVQKTAEIGLQEVAFANDPRHLVLDHIFLRGCESVNSEVHGEIDSSDHFPLTTEVLCH